MATIDIKNLTFSHDGGNTVIFDNVSFRIDTNWKLGFIGRNGRGKTTFLDLLCGKYDYSGKITASVKFDYFPFPVKDKTELCPDILHEICPAAEEWEMLRELNLIQVDCNALYRPFCELSGGEQTKILLCGLFLNNENFLLIDEPTDHLDATARQAVADYLNKKNGFILVSHDRTFLDGCVDHILAINKNNIEVRNGNFSSWYENFQNKQAFETTQNERLKKDIDRLTAAAKKTKEWANKVEATKNSGKLDSGLKPDRGHIGHQSAKMMKRKQAIEVNIRRAIDKKSNLLTDVEKQYDLKLSPLTHHSQRVVSFSDVSIFYGEREILSHINLEINNGERVALDGKNGCGKSSVLKLIAGEQIAHSGNITTASGLIISYVSQFTDHLKGDLRDFATDNHIDESLFKTVLRKMDFKIDEFYSDISDYSQGQKKKVLLAKSLCEKAHLYIWDEPLNFIDIYSRMQIENLIKEFAPTMLFVEHDTAFRRSISTRVLRI